MFLTVKNSFNSGAVKFLSLPSFNRPENFFSRSSIFGPLSPFFGSSSSSKSLSDSSLTFLPFFIADPFALFLPLPFTSSSESSSDYSLSFLFLAFLGC
jgi:hypothetical protein